MKYLIIISGIILMIGGYSSGLTHSAAVGGSMSTLGQSRAIVLSVISLFGTLTGGALVWAVASEKRRARREHAAYELKLDAFKRSIRR
jgi:hypothetical protein